MALVVLVTELVLPLQTAVVALPWAAAGRVHQQGTTHRHSRVLVAQVVVATRVVVEEAAGQLLLSLLQQVLRVGVGQVVVHLSQESQREAWGWVLAHWRLQLVGLVHSVVAAVRQSGLGAPAAWHCSASLLPCPPPLTPQPPTAVRSLS
jgi:hypothetical protein